MVHLNVMPSYVHVEMGLTNYEEIFKIKTPRSSAVASYPVFVFVSGNRVRWRGQRRMFTRASSSLTLGAL
jgi:hypothetical protein